MCAVRRIVRYITGIGRATANSNAAVEETRGQYLYEKNKKVVGYFFFLMAVQPNRLSMCRGGNYAYLTGKKDPYEKTESISNGVWNKTLTAAELRRKLTASGTQHWRDPVCAGHETT